MYRVSGSGSSPSTCSGGVNLCAAASAPRSRDSSIASAARERAKYTKTGRRRDATHSAFVARRRRTPDPTGHRAPPACGRSSSSRVQRHRGPPRDGAHARRIRRHTRTYVQIFFSIFVFGASRRREAAFSQGEAVGGARERGARAPPRGAASWAPARRLRGRACAPTEPSPPLRRGLVRVGEASRGTPRGRGGAARAAAQHEALRSQRPCRRGEFCERTDSTTTRSVSFIRIMFLLGACNHTWQGD